MAIVSDDYTATFRRVPFTKPPDMDRMLTPLPRAMVMFVVNGSAVSIKPINDQQVLDVQCNLPLEFAYRMIDADLTVKQDVAFAYQAGGELQVANALRGNPLGITTRHAMIATAESFSDSPITQQVHYRVSALPTFIMQSIRSGIAPFFDFIVVNNTAPAGVAGTIRFLCRCYEYDIEQVQMFPSLVPGSLTYDLGRP